MINQLNQLHELIQIYILIEGILITCCNSGNDINSSTDSDPELSRSSFLNRFPSRLISSASKLVAISIGKLASFPILFVFSLISSQQSTGLLHGMILPESFVIINFVILKWLYSAEYDYILDIYPASVSKLL